MKNRMEKELYMGVCHKYMHNDPKVYGDRDDKPYRINRICSGSGIGEIWVCM